MDKVANDLGALDAAQRKVAVSGDVMATVTDSTARRQLSAAKSFESLRSRVDDAYRTQQQFAKAQTLADRALQQGVVTVNDHARVVDLARMKYLGAATANDNMAKSTGLARYEMINLSRQIQDVGVSLAGGQSPFTVLVQQGTQIGDVFGSSQGTVRGFASQVIGMITPMRLLGLGTLAVAAAGYALYSSWKSVELQFDDTARAAGVTVRRMHELEAAASFKGIKTDDFLPSMEKFAAQVYQARNSAGGLAEVMQANGLHAKTFDDYLNRAADLIRNASSDQQRLVLLQQMGLPATMEWVRFLAQGSDGLRRAAAEATQFGGAANDNMIAKAREFDEAWNKALKNLSLGFRGAFVDAFDWLSNLSNRLTAVLISLDKLTGG